MSWRYVVISSRSKLDLRYDNLIIRTEDKVMNINISEISTLVLESTAISLTVALLSKLIDKKVKVVFCDNKRDPISELIPYYGRYDSSLKIKKQIIWNKNIKAKVWQEIIRDKIQKQAINLIKNGKPNFDLLLKYAEEVKINDKTNREGHAAKVYFNSLYGNDFCRDNENATNSALNYGYKIILSFFNRELSSLGYLTQLGIFHSNQFNHFNLSSDLMEPFRVLVDDLVYRESFKSFGTNEKRIIQKLHERKLTIDGKKQFLPNSIQIYTKSVINAIESDDINKIRFFEYEL
ncbi:MAG: type II CRISPR-associated endonuclease Cas1 [Andreesenia angusta]|nr:type II CRISPR-associated endonuclease Cas1 [Andreesenia angusta]